MKKYFLLTMLVYFLSVIHVKAQCISFCPPSTSSGLTSLYVGDSRDIIGDSVEEDDLLNWATAKGFNYLILGKIKQFLANAPNSNGKKLGDFIAKAHGQGFMIGVIVPSYNGSLPIKAYLDNPKAILDRNRWYDVIHFEQEYWNSNTNNTWYDPSPEIDSFKETLEDLYSFCQEKDILCEVYIGNPTHGTTAQNTQGQLEINHMIDHTDRIHVDFYRDDPYTPSPNIFLSKLWRLEFLANADDPANISAIFNANGSSSGPNMNDWLDDIYYFSDAPFEVPFNVWHDCTEGFLDNLQNNTSNLDFSLDNINVLGYTWFKYESLVEFPLSTPPIIDPCGMQFRKEAQTQIFPNPANQRIEVILKEKSPIAIYEILDITGKVVLSGKLPSSSANINVGQLAEGIYIFQVIDGDIQLATERLLIQR